MSDKAPPKGSQLGNYKRADYFEAEYERLKARVAELEQYKSWAEPQIVTHGDDLNRIAAMEEAMKILSQALIEVSHAQDVGSSWYTKGHSGLYQQVAMWVRKGRQAIAELKT